MKIPSKVKKSIACFITSALVTNIMPTMVSYADSKENSFTYDNYSVNYNVVNEWTEGKSIEITITNTGDEPILNWAFKYDAGGKIDGLWNAEAYESRGSTYIVKNVGWNYEIAPKSSVVFGYTLTGSTDSEPESFDLCSERKNITIGFSADANITMSWDTGIQGEIIITNTSENALEAWQLDFDSSISLDNIWNARVISSEGGHYCVASENWTNPIAAGEYISIGFVGSKEADSDVIINNFELSVVEIKGLDAKINWEAAEDTDGDGLTDVIEINLLGTDPYNADTDNDGLTDYQEIYLTNSDPLVYNSINGDCSDADADPDKDGLTNANEIKLGTNPLNGDSDGDGLSDGDEVNIYGTDPLKVDSDDDKLTDSDELTLSTDPLNPDTNGNGVLDGDELYTVNIDKSNIESSLFEDNTAIPSLSVTSHGNANSTVDVTEYIGNEQVDEFCVGKTVVITGRDIESGTLTFDISDISAFDEYEYADDVSASSIIICYNDGTKTIPLISEIDRENRTISAEISGEGTYFVFDVSEMLVSYDKAVIRDDITVETEKEHSGESNVYEDVDLEFKYELGGQADIVFIIDVTGSMGGAINNVKANISNFADEIKSSGIRPRFALVEFGDITCDGIDSTKTHYNGSSEWFTDIDSFKSELNKLRATGGGDTPECAIDALAMAARLNLRNTAEKCFVLVTDANYKINNRYLYSTAGDLFGELAENDICVSVVTSSSYKSVYDPVITKTSGIWCNIYGQFSKELLKISEFISEKTNNGYWIALNGLLPYVVRLDDELKAGSTTDSDNDGLYDNQEVGEKTIFPTRDMIRAALASSKTEIIDISYLYADVEVYEYTSSPVDKDSDGDGLYDNDYRYDANGKIIAPIDDQPKIPNGPKGMWDRHVKAVENGDVPTYLEKYYQMDLSNHTYGDISFDDLDIFDSKSVYDFLKKYTTGEWEDIATGVGSRVLMFMMDNKGQALHSQTMADRYDYVVRVLEDTFDVPDFISDMMHSDIVKGLISGFPLQMDTWQRPFGYNNLYDAAFDYGTNGNMANEKFLFYNDTLFSFLGFNDEYVLWVWRGDYLNCGPGAEMGIYKKTIDIDVMGTKIQHWVAADFTVPMTLNLYDYKDEDNIKCIFNWFPSNPQWWITGFNPNEEYNDVSKQVMIGSVDLSKFTDFWGNNKMYSSMKDRVLGDNRLKNFAIFDDENKTVWLCWNGVNH